MSKRALQAVVLPFGVLPVVTGLLAVTGGPAGMLVAQRTNSTVDSEVRFMAVYWLAYGVFVLRLVPRIAHAGGAFRAALVVMFGSGLARLLSILEVGRPHPVLFAATFVELLLPPVLWWWQAAVAAAATRPPAKIERDNGGSDHGISDADERQPAAR
ncbi:DUF4345 domain-containing protein [Micromonospora sp. NPDC050980]|uniref:DUF4345 domain-containing protein n=1 Tax=Micromonospora sp. NPDC050980 TaxID=3155161 RepID=UPI0033D693A6